MSQVGIGHGQWVESQMKANQSKNKNKNRKQL